MCLRHTLSHETTCAGASASPGTWMCPAAAGGRDSGKNHAFAGITRGRAWMPGSSVCLSVTGNRHLTDEYRARAYGAAQVLVISHDHDVKEHLLQISRDRDLVYGIGDSAVLHPEATRAPVLVSRLPVHSLPHQLRDQQSIVLPREIALHVYSLTRLRDYDVMNTASVSGGLEAEAARRITPLHFFFE